MERAMPRACRELTAMRPAVGAVGVTALIAACGGGGPAPARRASSGAAAHRTASSPSALRTCITSGGYGGLGAYASAFDANDNDSTGLAEPTPGAANGFPGVAKIEATSNPAC
jgi:hypothetical protein